MILNADRGLKIVEDKGAGPCAKQTVTATLVASDGTHFKATNHCDTPQNTCPRGGMPTGKGYELCKSVCNQRAHAEVNAIKLAGDKALGARIFIEGHTYACERCLEAAKIAGVAEILIGKRVDEQENGC